MPAATTRNQGKSAFVKEHLNDAPHSNPAAVNEAWTSAGMSGQISASLINKVRAEMGLTGNIRPGPKSKSGKSQARARVGRPSKKGKPGRKPRVASAVVKPRGVRSEARVLNEIEADLDRLIFKAMTIAQLAELEDALRRARRSLYRQLDQN